MCNCGKKRNEFIKQRADYTQPTNFTHQPFMQSKQTVLFEYTGLTALTVTGGITRKVYRFNFPGDKQFIEVSDVNGIMSIPVLKKIN